RERSRHDLMVLGLLKRNLTAAAASAESGVIASRLGQRYPATNESRSMTVAPLSESNDQVTRQFVLVLVGATLFVLLLACANIGNLQLARAAKRQKEIAVRAALGATRLQIARQLLAESLLISLTAGGIGLFLASWEVDLRKSELPAMVFRILPGAANMRVDATVVLLTIAASLVAGVLCSLPAIQLVMRRMRTDLRGVLQERGGNQSALPAQNRMRSALVVFQLAMALVLLTGAGLMVNTFQRLLNRYQGFDQKNLLTMQVSLPGTAYRNPAQIASFYDRALERLTANAGVKTVAISSTLGTAERFATEARPEPRPGEPRPDVMAVSENYLSAMRIPLLSGRFLSNRDRASTPAVAVVSETLARHYWPHANPIGKRIRLNKSSGWLTVVGVSGDVIDDWFSGLPSPAAYVPYSQRPSLSARILLRTSGHPLRAAPAARAAIRSVDKDLPVYDLETMEKDMTDERSGVHAAAVSMTEYALIALLLSITGIYGVLSYFVAARTHEIGIRMALGASRIDILKMTTWKAAELTAMGLFIGIPLAVLLSHTMSSALDGVVYIDPMTFALFAGILAASALLAGYLPSRRATRIDPMTALRTE
ncbi:MAG: FtsX-like permease family protein, partial [Bryobacteraceae bacterium]